MEKIPQYQRAVTPTIDSNGNTGFVRGKVLSYSSNNVRSKVTTKTYIGSEKVGISNGNNARSGAISPRPTIGYNVPQTDMNIQGKATNPRSLGMTQTSTSFRTSLTPDGAISEQLSSLSVLPRYDLVPLSDDLPADGVIFSRIRNQPDSLVVFRTHDERLRNPERLNLDRRQLEVCPLLEQEQRLRLLNYQNNNIRSIQNLENLPNLIFLDLYNNKISTLDGPLSTVKGLRVLMAGKNKIGMISNLTALRKLDVLDLHSNEIRAIEGLEGLSDLRVLNLAGMSRILH
jgi:Leucine-rich repeat (LRR) protein